MGLAITVDIQVLDDDVRGEIVRDVARLGEERATGLAMRICHPEASKDGTCPECWAHNGRVFDAENMQGVDGLGLVPAIPLHPNCKCEDIAYLTARAAGVKPQIKLETLGNLSEADLIKAFGVAKGRAVARRLIGIEDAYIVSRAGRMIEGNLKTVAASMAEETMTRLEQIARRVGATKAEMQGLKKSGLVELIMSKLRKRGG